MADEADRAEEYEAKHREAALTHRKPVPRHTGYCLNGCGRKAAGAYCDAECQKDHEEKGNGRT